MKKNEHSLGTGWEAVYAVFDYSTKGHSRNPKEKLHLYFPVLLFLQKPKWELCMEGVKDSLTCREEKLPVLIQPCKPWASNWTVFREAGGLSWLTDYSDKKLAEMMEYEAWSKWGTVWYHYKLKKILCRCLCIPVSRDYWASIRQRNNPLLFKAPYTENSFICTRKGNSGRLAGVAFPQRVHVNYKMHHWFKMKDYIVLYQ